MLLQNTNLRLYYIQYPETAFFGQAIFISMVLCERDSLKGLSQRYNNEEKTQTELYIYRMTSIIYNEACAHIIRLKYSETGATNGNDENENIQKVCGEASPVEKETSGNKNQRGFILLSSLSSSAPGSSMVGLGGRGWY
jgi:hypothetical protein